ncbi:hypothetical protein AcV5_004658 [Taiwanofungus camphoratus]|nr:hypothetical protein AcV5_004658 [Antrodia cinnamomea]KAI0961770.1 hypothetical protein AcV7_000778 [Antrodia cinnamomea]
MKPRDYCCCAIPVIYAGIYTTLVEQFTLGIVAGTLSVATPSIVGAATPSFAKWIFAIICYVGAALQLLGLHAVWSERPITFRRYTTLHLLITIAAFSVAAVWIALSAARHSHAEATCEATFFPENSSITSSEGQTLCNVFSWVDVGLMGGLWVLLAIVQLYLYVVLSSYASGNERDHAKYGSLYDSTPFTSGDIPLRNRSDPWESDPLAAPLGHGRSDSLASVSTVMGDKVQQPRNYDAYGQAAYSPAQPGHAYTQDPGPTPGVMDNYYSEGYDGGVDYPERSQAHPAEGSFRRKTPRLQKPHSEDFDLNMLSHR